MSLWLCCSCLNLSDTLYPADPADPAVEGVMIPSALFYVNTNSAFLSNWYSDS